LPNIDRWAATTLKDERLPKAHSEGRVVLTVQQQTRPRALGETHGSSIGVGHPCCDDASFSENSIEALASRCLREHSHFYRMQLSGVRRRVLGEVDDEI